MLETSVWFVAGPSGGLIPNSRQMETSNSTTDNSGLRMKATSAPSGNVSNRRRQAVVLPAPTSPVSRTKPPSLLIPYIRCASASACPALRKKKWGSGTMEKGFLENPKYSSYMVSQSSHIDLVIGFFQPGNQYTRNEMEKEAWRGDLRNEVPCALKSNQALTNMI